MARVDSARTRKVGRTINAMRAAAHWRLIRRPIRAWDLSGGNLVELRTSFIRDEFIAGKIPVSRWSVPGYSPGDRVVFHPAVRPVL